MRSYSTHSNVLSLTHRNTAITTTNANTAAVVCTVSLRVGQTTFFSSTSASRAKTTKSRPGPLIQATAAPAAKPGSITPHAKFECEVYILSKEEGGRHTPFFNNYRPQFYFRTTDVTGAVELPKGTEMVMPGDNIKMVVTLITPIAMEQGLRFAIREGGKTVGAGVVAKVIE